MRGQAGDALAALQQRVYGSKRFADDVLHAHEPAPNALFRKLEDSRFRVAQQADDSSRQVLFNFPVAWNGPGDTGPGTAILIVLTTVANQYPLQRFDKIDPLHDNTKSSTRRMPGIVPPVIS